VAEVTTFPWTGRLVPAVLRLVARAGGREHYPGPLPDGDLLSWLGFEPGQGADEPCLSWSRPAAWPTGRLGVA
jgi:hypothetical protein